MEPLRLHVRPLYTPGIIVRMECIPAWWLLRLLNGVVGRDVRFRLEPFTDLLVELLRC